MTVVPLSDLTKANLLNSLFFCKTRHVREALGYIVATRLIWKVFAFTCNGGKTNKQSCWVNNNMENLVFIRPFPPPPLRRSQWMIIYTLQFLISHSGCLHGAEILTVIMLSFALFSPLSRLPSLSLCRALHCTARLAKVSTSTHTHGWPTTTPA